MNFDASKDRIIGQTEFYDSGIGKISVEGFYNEGTYTRLSQREAEETFPPYGKVFIAKNELLPKGIHTGDFIEFSSIPSQQKEIQNYDNYILDLYNNPAKLIVPKIVYTNNLKKDASTLKFHLCEKPSYGEQWTGYLYNSDNKILYEEIINYESTGIEAKKDTFVQGIFYDLQKDKNLIKLTQNFAYVSKYFKPNFEENNIVHIIDLANQNQKIKWFKKQLQEQNKLNKDSSENIKHLLNIIAITNFPDNHNLIKTRLSAVNNMLENITFTDDEIKKLLTNDSNIGNYLIHEILRVKKDYFTKKLKEQNDIFEQTKQTLNESLIKLEEKNQKLIKTQIQQQCQEMQKLRLSTQKIKDENAILIKKKQTLTSELATLKNSQDVIYVTIKTLLDNYQVDFSQSRELNNRKNNTNSSPTEQDKVNNITYDIFDIKSKKSIVNTTSIDNLESCFHLSPKFQDLPYIIKNKFSFIPSISWCYTLAQFLGNAKVLNMPIEYDWLHYEDFVKHGLLEFIEDCDKNPTQFFFLHLEHLNIIPVNCGFNTIYQVFSGEKPYFAGTNKGLPKNLFVTATLLPTTNEESIGNKIPDFYLSLFKGLGNPLSRKPMQFNSIKQTYSFIYNETFQTLINDLPELQEENYNEY